ncbi:MAG: creatininase family protein [Anaerolineales bacterium]|nr:creatininase family protein [Anaerolineales bacterium]
MLWRLERLFPDDLQARLAACPALVLPFGTIEWHSYHLPVGLDGLVALVISERIAEPLGAVLAPVSYWAAGGVPYPFTLNLAGGLIEPVLTAAFEQFGAMGFRVLVAFTGHFGLEQTLVLKRAALTVMRRSPVLILPLTEYDLVTELYVGDHAGIGETSLLWAVAPDLVRLGQLPADRVLDGVLGADPRPTASPERGRQLLDTISTRAAAMAERLLYRTSALDRADYLEAVAAGVRVLERTLEQRQLKPKREVPALTTPAYLDYCRALYAGDYRLACSRAEQKWGALDH